jgi:hypothetical protein
MRAHERTRRFNGVLALAVPGRKGSPGGDALMRGGRNADEVRLRTAKSRPLPCQANMRTCMGARACVCVSVRLGACESTCACRSAWPRRRAGVAA